MNHFAYYFFGLFTLTISAQQIVVADETTREPLPGTAVFNQVKTKTFVTDIDGQVGLEKFQDFEKIYVQHLSYHKISVLKSSIQDTVFLAPKATSLNEVVIAASKFKQSKKEVPQNMISIRFNLFF